MLTGADGIALSGDKETLFWSETLAWGPNGSPYIVSNHLSLWVNGDINIHHPKVPNFRIWRIPNIGKSHTTP